MHDLMTKHPKEKDPASRTSSSCHGGRKCFVPNILKQKAPQAHLGNLPPASFTRCTRQAHLPTQEIADACRHKGDVIGRLSYLSNHLQPVLPICSHSACSTELDMYEAANHTSQPGLSCHERLVITTTLIVALASFQISSIEE
jgi:hypothetical protein